MIALTAGLPGKSSRTSTHAISVPKNAFTSTTSADARSVSLIAASACGLETSLPNALAPRARRCSARGPGSGSAEGLFGSGDPQRLLDLGDNARFGFEEQLG